MTQRWRRLINEQWLITASSLRNALGAILRSVTIWWFPLLYWSVALWWVDGAGVRRVVDA